MKVAVLTSTESQQSPSGNDFSDTMAHDEEFESFVDEYDQVEHNDARSADLHARLVNNSNIDRKATARGTEQIIFGLAFEQPLLRHLSSAPL